MIANAPPAPPPIVAAVRQALIERLDRRGLSYRWIVCFPDRRRYVGLRVVRCRVHFGDPHVVQYCAVIRRGRLVTDHENRAIRCGTGPDPILGIAWPLNLFDRSLGISRRHPSEPRAPPPAPRRPPAPG